MKTEVGGALSCEVSVPQKQNTCIISRIKPHIILLVAHGECSVPLSEDMVLLWCQIKLTPGAL